MTLFQINKFLAAVIVPISYGSIENVAKAKSDTHNAIPIKVNFSYTLLELKGYNFRSTISKYMVIENIKDLS